MSPVTACLLALLTVGFLVVKQDASVLQEVEADALAVEEAERGTSVSDKITQLTQGMETCVDNEDMNCLLAYLDDNVRVMREHHPVQIGKTEARKHMKWIEHDFDATLEIKEITPSTDGSIVVERLKITMKFPNGTSIFNGKGVFVWKKVNNDYKVYIDIFNDN
ncbi:uncharacterized protein LOC119728988 isoform X2 [Patiria miniata]|uniref:DUF4440 domain-containing protein n=1 Tax=Patiria miniata TaxID=46514 RepID=A0A914A0I8_PATMI|nr:uncharacterized protein LOC119728988 isoform X2 [Patiria miniata]